MKTEKNDVLKRIRTGVRLKVKPPKTEIPKNTYSRKEKHRRNYSDGFSFFYPFSFVMYEARRFLKKSRYSFCL